MSGGSRYAWGREPAGQLPTSRTMSDRADVHPRVVEHRSRRAAHPRPPCRRERAGGRPALRPLDHTLIEVAPEREHGPVLAGKRRRPRRQRVGIWHVRRVQVLVLEALDVAHGPHHGVEHRPALLAHLDALGRRGAAGAQRGDHEVDRREGGDREVVAEEAGGTGEGALGPGGPEGDGGHVPATGAPDLPVAPHLRAVAAVRQTFERRVHLDVTHGSGPPIAPSSAR